MKINEILNEARRNPELNPKNSINSILQQVYDNSLPLDTPNQDITNAFVSFTSVPKLGINPSSKYNTPFGIYSYPIGYVIYRVGSEEPMSKLPFAGESPWANIFSIKKDSNIINLVSMTEDQYEEYCERLKNLVPTLLSEKYIKSMPWNPPHKLIDSLMKKSVEEASQKEYAGGRFWYVTKTLAQHIAKDKENNPAVAWNYIFRKLDIAGCIDTGVGIIHPSEKSQAVFYSMNNINIIDRVANKYSKSAIQTNISTGLSNKQIQTQYLKVINDLYTQGNLLNLRNYIVTSDDARTIVKYLPNKILFALIEFALKNKYPRDVFFYFSNLPLSRLTKSLIVFFLKLYPFIMHNKYGHTELFKKLITPTEYATILNSYLNTDSMLVDNIKLEIIFQSMRSNNIDYLLSLVRANPNIWHTIHTTLGNTVDPTVYQYTYKRMKELNFSKVAIDELIDSGLV